VPEVGRPDGVEIAWEERGEGKTVVLSHHWFGHPSVLDGLLGDLARDFRVVTYDPRGTGGSTRSGPYDAETDVGDLTALLGELGEAAAVIGWGSDGAARAVRVAARRADLCGAVVAIGAMPLGREAFSGTDSPAESELARDAMGKGIRTSYRFALRQVIEATSVPMSEAQIKQRVRMQLDYCEHDAAIGRYESWRSTDLTREARELRGRLWLVLFDTRLGSPDRFAAKARELVPEAQVVVEADGPVHRPDRTATLVRRAIEVTASARYG
jgi:pimeloyl-ACP methyl ester carboxylesterase